MLHRLGIASSLGWRVGLFGGLFAVSSFFAAHAETLPYDTKPRHELPWVRPIGEPTTLNQNPYETRRVATKVEKQQKLAEGKKPKLPAPKEKPIELAQAAPPTSLKIVIPNLNAAKQGDAPPAVDLAPPQPAATFIAEAAPVASSPPEELSPAAGQPAPAQATSTESEQGKSTFSLGGLLGGLFVQDSPPTDTPAGKELAAENAKSEDIPKEPAIELPVVTEQTDHEQPGTQPLKTEASAKIVLAALFGEGQTFSQSAPDTPQVSNAPTEAAVSAKQLKDAPIKPTETLTAVIHATDKALTSKEQARAPAQKTDPSWLEMLLTKEEADAPTPPKKIKIVVEQPAPVPSPVATPNDDIITLLADSRALEAPVAGSAPAAPVILVGSSENTQPAKPIQLASQPPMAKKAEKAKKEKPAGPIMVIKKAELKIAEASVQLPDPLALSELSPSAGEPTDDNTPLIQLPSPDAAPTPLPAPAAESKKEETVPNAVIPLLDQGLSGDVKATDTVKDAAKPAADLPPTENKPNTPASTTQVESLLNPLPDTKSASKAPEALPAIATPAAPVPKPVPVEEPAVISPSEPSMDLSAESKKIAKKIPSNMDKKNTGDTEKLNIDRAKDVQDALKPEAQQEIAVKHEAMGIKIEVKNQKSNLNYELEKAYNAILTGHAESAIEIYKMVLANDPNNKNALFGLATTYHRAGQLDQARELYGKLLAVDPRNRDGLNNFLVLLADEAPEAALGQMEALEKRNPSFSPIPAQMAVIYQKLGDANKASEYMFKAVALAPENLTYRYNLAIMLDKQKKYDEAVKLYSQLMEAYVRGEVIPGNPQKIQERLTFIRSNRH